MTLSFSQARGCGLPWVIVGRFGRKMRKIRAAPCMAYHRFKLYGAVFSIIRSLALSVNQKV